MTMQADLHNIQGQVVGVIDLDESVWGIEPNIPVMHQAVVRQQANARLGTHETKTRGEVRGGGRKPWRQKGTGRARQGSIRSPQWKGGGVVFGPHPRSYEQDMPKQMRRLALRSALSAKMSDNCVTVVQGLGEIEPKTKAFKDLLGKFPEARSVLVILGEKSDAVQRASSNLAETKTVIAPTLSVRDLLRYERILVTEDAVTVIEEVWALPEEKRTPSTWKQERLAAKAAAVEGGA